MGCRVAFVVAFSEMLLLWREFEVEGGIAFWKFEW